MASVNKVILVGNLGKDPELKYSPSGDAFANVSIATTESWKDKTTGEKKDATEWHRLVFNGALAEIVGKYLKKGAPIYVEGQIRTRKWTNKEGVDQYTTEIRADKMQMLGSKADAAAPAPAQTQHERAKSNGYAPIPSAMAGDFDDDVPF